MNEGDIEYNSLVCTNCLKPFQEIVPSSKLNLKRKNTLKPYILSTALDS